MFAQSYESLWKKVDDAERKDLPREQIASLEQIISLSERSKDYGQMLAAQVKRMGVRVSISPDSLRNDVKEFEGKAAKEKDPALVAVYNTVLGDIYALTGLAEDGGEKSKEYYTKALADPAVLASCQTTKYRPLVSEEEDSRIFNNDLLHVIGMRAKRYDILHDYYKKVGNRRAALITALEIIEQADDGHELQSIDALIKEYGDLPECCEAAALYADYMEGKKPREKYEFLQNALKRWGTYSRAAILENRLLYLQEPEFTAKSGSVVWLSGKKQTIRLEQVRNVKKISVTISRLNVKGNEDLNPDDGNLKRLKNTVTSTVFTDSRTFDAAPYDYVSDSIVVPGLPRGVYLVRYSTDNPKVGEVYETVSVSDLFLVFEEMPDKQLRMAVVSATTGKPIEGAKIRLTYGRNGNANKEVVTLTTDKLGEVVYKHPDRWDGMVYFYTDDDNGYPEQNLWSSYSYYKSHESPETTYLFTDRQIYRPGQTVHASVIACHVISPEEMGVDAQKNLVLTLRDANNKLVAEKKVTTDGYGVASADLELPANGLTGRFTLHTSGNGYGSTDIQVEEYKRPTFEITIPEYKEKYAAGDTLHVKAYAKSYAGVPVQNAKVVYTVKRTGTYWWWYYDSDDNEDVFEGKAMTDDEGAFVMDVPLTLPEKKSRHDQFFNFVAEAIVTDQGGESHAGSITLPLGTRNTVLMSSLPSKIEADSLKSFSFSYRNAAGQQIPGRVSYRIDTKKDSNVKMKTVDVNTEIKLDKMKSGKYYLYAVCGTDTLEREMIVFSVDDKRPVDETHDWFYQSAKQFPSDGKPVYIQVGASDEQHILYTVFSGNKIIEKGVIDQNNAIKTFRYTYKPEYGDGITLTYVWVHDGVAYPHEAKIYRPEPDKRLVVKWKTFRDRLEPGDKEEWTMSVTTPDGKPAEAHVMATLFDKSLDQIMKHIWDFEPKFYLSLLSVNWRYPSFAEPYEFSTYSLPRKKVKELAFSSFDADLFDDFEPLMVWQYRQSKRMMKGRNLATVQFDAVTEAAKEEAPVLNEVMVVTAAGSAAEEDNGKSSKSDAGQVRENLDETAFFYPDLTTDGSGNVAIKFTLPQSVTTWRFIGLAHDKELRRGILDGETVAQKTVMVQPNMPRFVREGDDATITTRLFNTSENPVSGVVRLELVDPSTEKLVYTQKHDYNIASQSTASATFDVPTRTLVDAVASQLYIVRVVAEGDGYSDGEQHYLPVLPSREYVTNTRPFSQNGPGVKTVSLKEMIPSTASQPKVTVEYTNNPTWLMIQALPYVADANDDNAISLAAAYYANAIGANIIRQNPTIKNVFQQWKQEKGEESPLTSSLQKDQTLKELVLNETPWVMGAETESEQKRMLGKFFDENTLAMNQSSIMKRLRKLQQIDGSFSWWSGMGGNFYMTVAVAKICTRLNVMTGDEDAKSVVSDAWSYLDSEVAKRVKEMKQLAKMGVKVFPSDGLCDYLYINALAGRSTTADITYLVDLLAKKPRDLTIYGKANTAVILAQYGKTKTAAEYLQSVSEYTVYKEEMGRYFDTSKALYSWFDYKIPTQTAVIEAYRALKPEATQTIDELQRWLLQAKRTQKWDTPLNSVDAVYAFLGGKTESSQVSQLASRVATTISMDGKPIELPQATAGIGYVKVGDVAHGSGDLSSSEISFNKTSEGVSWGAVYAQFFQPTTDIADAASGIKVQREVIDGGSTNLKVGDKVRIRLTIIADRDYDFVQVIDKRAACLEPVNQLSGYHWGYYIAPKDNTTNYYFDRMAKGKHVIGTEYYVDRAGNYQTGTCTVQCAYAPEYSGRTGAMNIKVKSE